MKKIGIAIALTSNRFEGEIYLAENNVLTPNLEMAKTFRASEKVLTTIKTQIVAQYPELGLVATNIERWA